MNLVRILLVGTVCLSIRLHSAEFMVASTADSGEGSLRQAIIDANANPGPDSISFNLPGAGLQTITLTSALPMIIEPVVIDGTTQPGYSGAPLIDLNGNAGGGRNGLFIAASNCVVRALVVRNFGSSSSRASGILLSNASGNVIEGCYIGTSGDGAVASRNALDGIRLDNSANNRIGGAGPNQGNVISGNSQKGIFIFGPGSKGNEILGNRIGLNANGQSNLSNNQGIVLSNATDNVIGGRITGARNVVAGQSSGPNIQLLAGANRNVIEGNYVGLRSDGTALTVEPATPHGVAIQDSAANAIGGLGMGAGNVISGNRFGVLITGPSSTNNLVAGNYLGTDPSGLAAIGNSIGIYISSGAGGNVVGGTNAAARNLISGNVTDGLSISDASDNLVQGNFIGTDLTGNSALPNTKAGTQGSGVSIASISGQSTRNLIGGHEPGAPNVISGNNDKGVTLTGAATVENAVQRNSIGVGADGRPMGNINRGVVILGAVSNVIGGPFAGNVIANSRLEGVWLAGLFGAFGAVGTNNLVQANTICSNAGNGVTLLGPNKVTQCSIFANGLLGIDRGGDGPTPNVDGGIHNSPVLTLARQGSTVVGGTLQGKANAHYNVEMFSNLAIDPLAQARTYLGIVKLTTGADGRGNFQATFDPSAAVGDKITAISFGPLEPGDPLELGGESSEISSFIPVEGSTPILQPLSFANTIFAGTVGHPISTFTGELFDLLPPDLVIEGPMPLLFQRYYASFLNRDGKIAGVLGDNWLHNYEWALRRSNDVVEVVNHLGRVITFKQEAGGYVLIGRREIPFQLTVRGENFVLGDPRSQRLFTFNSAGKLIEIADGKGNVQTLSYAGSQLTAVSDGLGALLSFNYDGAGRLTNVTDGTRSVGFTQAGNNLAEVRSALGFVTSYSYDPTNAQSGLLIAMTKPEGNTPFSQSYDAQGRVAAQTTEGTNVWKLSYSDFLVTRITDPSSNVVQDLHSPTGALLSFSDETGSGISIESNEAGQRSHVTDRHGRTTAIAYHAPSGKPASITYADGGIARFQYSARTNDGIVFYDLAQVIHRDGSTNTFIYDNQGNLTRWIDPKGKSSEFTYDARGGLIKEVNPIGDEQSFTYNTNGTLATLTDSEFGVTRLAYDHLRRLTNITAPDGATVQASYDAGDRLTALTDERGGITGFSYDRNDRLVAVTNALGHATRFVYDAQDRVVQRIDPLGGVTGLQFDARGSLSAITNRNGMVTRFSYDARGRLVLRTDSANQTWRYDYDQEDLLIATANPLNETNRISRDPLGSVTASTNALSQVRWVARDEGHRITAFTDEAGRVRRFFYDQGGYLTNASLPFVGGATYYRDSMGTLGGLLGLNGEPWNFGYDLVGLRLVFDPLGRKTEFLKGIRGRVSEIRYPEGTIRTNEYDQSGNLAAISYNQGPVLKFDYDKVGRLVSANDISWRYDAAGRVTNTLSSGVNFGSIRDPGGRVIAATYNNGALAVHYGYDSGNRLARVNDSLTGAQLDFRYDAAGRLTNVVRANGVNGAWTYDAAGRLIRIQEGAIIDIEYGLNPAGAVVQAQFKAPIDPANHLPQTNPVFTYDLAHQIADPGFAYDGRGRLIVSPGHTYAWDGATRLVGVDGVTLSYNGLGDLIGRTEGFANTHYYYNDGIKGRPMVAERKGNDGPFEKFYVWTPNGRLLYMIDAANGNAVSFFHFDRLGSALALTSATGTVTDAYAYSPYGVLLARTGTNTQPFTFIGAFGVRSESAGKLYQMRARYYDPVTARFLSRDPVWPRLASPASLNPYQYALRNPLRYIDPTGNQDDEDAGDDEGEGDDEEEPLELPEEDGATWDYKTGPYAIERPVPDMIQSGRGVSDLVGLFVNLKKSGEPNLTVNPVFPLDFPLQPKPASFLIQPLRPLIDDYFAFYTAGLNRRFLESAKVYTYEEEEDTQSRPPPRRRPRPAPPNITPNQISEPPVVSLESIVDWRN